MITAPLAARVAALLLVVSPSGTLAQKDGAPRPLRPAEGSLVLAGEGKLPDAAIDVFLHLSGGYSADIAVVSTTGKPKSATRWKKRGANSVVAIGKEPGSPEELSLALLEADGVWFEDGAEALRDDPLINAFLHDVLARGGAVGGQGEGALALAMDNDAGGFGLLASSRVLLAGKSVRASRKLELTGGDGLVTWQVPTETALVIAHGRRVGAVGERAVQVNIAGTDDWPAREATVDARSSFDFGDELSYDLDLLSWLRSAQDRTGPAFPPAKAATPKIAKGTLFLSGGGGVASPVWNRFIEAAGGKKSTFVCFPSASEFAPWEDPKSYGAGQLRDHGCTNVFVYHTSDPTRADEDPRLLELLEEATGVWIDGGRTFRFMDSFQYTRAAELMREVLEGGGAVGGSSAGCQVLGDFLVRGDPRTSSVLAFEGYTRGLGFLPGVTMDAHFLQRERHEPFVGLMDTYPQMLGIGVDEDTSLIVRGSEAEVIGRASVSFYDWSSSEREPVILGEGRRYDLAKRKALR